LCGGNVPWKAATPLETVVELASFFGGKQIIDLAAELQVEIPKDYVKKLLGAPKKRFNDFFSPQLKQLKDRDLLNLMEAFLSLKRKDRPSAPQALEHPFFSKQFRPASLTSFTAVPPLVTDG
jgi:serine/threonine protein kinase